MLENKSVDPPQVVVVDPVMTKEEARRCINEIQNHIQSIRHLLLELDERKGWQVLGYKSMRQCMLAEFPKSKSQLYRELQAGKIEKILSPMGDKLGDIPERQLRELGQLPQTEWPQAWQQVIETAPAKGVTTAHVASTVAKIRESLKNQLDLSLGDWVKLNNKESHWYGQQGAVIQVSSDQVKIRLDTEKQEILQMSFSEVEKIEPPLQELNQALSFQSGDIVLIKCPMTADIEQRVNNGCWGIVETVEKSTIKVNIKGKTVHYLFSDVKLVAGV